MLRQSGRCVYRKGLLATRQTLSNAPPSPLFHPLDCYSRCSVGRVAEISLWSLVAIKSRGCGLDQDTFQLVMIELGAALAGRARFPEIQAELAAAG